MSWYGDGTFKQDLLDEIEELISKHKLLKSDAVADVADVLANLALTAFNRDEQMERVKADAKEEVKRELIEQLKREIEYLRHYSNRDILAQVEDAMQQGSLDA